MQVLCSLPKNALQAFLAASRFSQAAGFWWDGQSTLGAFARIHCFFSKPDCPLQFSCMVFIAFCLARHFSGEGLVAQSLAKTGRASKAPSTRLQSFKDVFTVNSEGR